MTFWGNQFENKNGTITGTIKYADFVTDPIIANLTTLGNMTVSGSIHAGLPYLTQPVTLDTTLNGNVSADVTGQFRNVVSQNNLQLENIAYTMDLRRVNLTSTGPANVTLTIPPSWIDQYGGKDAVRIGRISDETGMGELLKTIYNGTDTHGNLVFRGESPNGSSIFGMLTAKMTAEKQKEQPNVTFQPLQKPAIATDIGMFAWLLGIVEQNPVLIVVAVAILAVAAYFGWWKRRF
jgi:hypothetical protein